jgi:hypothetical protein
MISWAWDGNELGETKCKVNRRQVGPVENNI